MKDQILQRATDLFLNLGFKSVTMDDLAQGMGISKKTIYAHFRNKTKLVEASTDHLFGQIRMGIEGIVAKEMDPIEELYEIKHFVMRQLKHEKAGVSHQLQKYYPKCHQKLRGKQFDMMYDCTRANIQRGIDKGIYRPELDVEFVMRIYFSGVTSIKDPELFPEERFGRHDLMDIFLEYHLRGIVTPEGRKKLNAIIQSNEP